MSNQKKKPNVIMFVADQYRADSIGYRGCKAAVTPNFDTLAEEGIAFNNAFCQNTVCVPSRISFLSGWYPHVKGYRTMHHLTDQHEPNLLRNMKENGYSVYWGGRNDFLREDVEHEAYYDVRNNEYAKTMGALMNRGKGADPKLLDQLKRHKEMKQNGPRSDKYSHYYGVGPVGAMGNADWEEVEAAIRYIEEYDEEKPLMMYLALALPHPPYTVEPKYYDQINPELIDETIRLSEEELKRKPAMMQGIREKQMLYDKTDDELKEIKRVYLAMGTKLDDAFGRLMEALKKKGMYDDSMVVMMSDHGDYTGDFEIAEKSQNTFEDVLTNVPLIIKPAQNTKSVGSHEAMVELLDIQATIYDVAGIEPAHTHFGKSLVPIFEGGQKHREFVVSEGGRLWDDLHCTDSGHSEDNEYWARTAVQDQMPAHSKAIMMRNEDYKFVYRLYEDHEFYDLRQDPQERNNEIHNPAYASKIREMESDLFRFYIETSDIVPHRRDKRAERSY